VNVPVPFVMLQICEYVSNVKYLSLMMDTSKHISLKQIPVIVRYLHPRKESKLKSLTSRILEENQLLFIKVYSS
jgi:hypothetical protein